MTSYQRYRHHTEECELECAVCLAKRGINSSDPACLWALLRPEEHPAWCNECGEELTV